jgi:hypothetical protein
MLLNYALNVFTFGDLFQRLYYPSPPGEKLSIAHLSRVKSFFLGKSRQLECYYVNSCGS